MRKGRNQKTSPKSNDEPAESLMTLRTPSTIRQPASSSTSDFNQLFNLISNFQDQVKTNFEEIQDNIKDLDERNDKRVSKIENQILAMSSTCQNPTSTPNTQNNSSRQSILTPQGTGNAPTSSQLDSLLNSFTKSTSSQSSTGYAVQRNYRDLEVTLTSLEDPDQVGIFARKLQMHMLKYGSEIQYHIALLLSDKVQNLLVARYGHKLGIDTVSFLQLSDADVLSMIISEARAPDLNTCLIRLKKELPYKMDSLKYGITASSYRYLMDSSLLAINSFMERFIVLYDPMHEEKVPEISDKEDGLLFIIHKLCRSACNENNYLETIWRQLSYSEQSAIKKCLRMDGSVGNKLDALKRYGDVVRAQMEVDLSHSDNARSLQAKLINKQVSNHGSTDYRTKTVYPSSSNSSTVLKRPTIPVRRLNNVNIDDSAEMGDDDAEVQDSDMFDDIDFENDFIHAIQSSSNNSTPRGCYEKLFYGRCKRIDAQTRGEKDANGRLIKCSYAHDSAAMKSLFTQMTGLLKSSPYNDSSNSKVSHISSTDELIKED
jgi:hypothetical protein